MSRRAAFGLVRKPHQTISVLTHRLDGFSVAITNTNTDMLLLKYGSIVNPMFQSAISALADYKFTSVASNLSVMRLIRELREHTNAYLKSRAALLEKHGTKKDNDTFALQPAQVRAFNEEIKLLDDQQVEINWEAIELPSNCPLSANELDQLIGTILVEPK